MEYPGEKSNDRGLGWKEELRSPCHETVLLVEDDEQVRGIARIALETAGYEVVTASDGDQAIRFLESIEFKIDLLISDLTMPGTLAGDELIARVNQQAPHIPSLLVTGFAQNISVDSKVLLKPFRLESLLAAARAELSNAKDAQTQQS